VVQLVDGLVEECGGGSAAGWHGRVQGVSQNNVGHVASQESIRGPPPLPRLSRKLGSEKRGDD